MHSAALVLAFIGMIGLACQWVSWSLRLPAILFLILAGILFGPVMGVVKPDAMFGDLLLPLVSLSVAIILFEGSLTLRFDELRGMGHVVRRVIVIGAPITWAVITGVTFLVLEVPFEVALLFGALVVVTGPTVIVPMLRTVRPNSRIANVLRWEGIVIDPIGALLAVLVYEYIVSSALTDAWVHTMWLFARVVFIGGCLGAAMGYGLGVILRRHWLPEYLQGFATFVLVLFTFALSNELVEESGLLAVTVMGMWLANMRGVFVEDILSFKEHLTILLISGLFILLAARIDLFAVLALGWPPLLVLLAIQFCARPLSIFISTLGANLTWQEKSLIAWIGPRGIVAAAVSALFALRLEEIGFENADLLVSMTFIIIIGTVVLQSATARPLARLLDVAEPDPEGVLFVGANRVARAMASALKEAGIKVLLVDASWENIRETRMQGLDTFYGNPVSAYTDKYLDMAGLGRLLAVAPQRETNVLASLRYRPEFGRENIYTLNTSIEVSSGKHSVAEELKGYVIADEELTFSKFSSLLSQGAKLRKTQLTDNFGFKQYRETNEDVYLLFAIDKRGRLHVFSEGRAFEPEAGWIILCLDYKDTAQAIAARQQKEDDELARQSELPGLDA
ncbi:MAG: sodium:proton antiporter [Gammaproteobacteria bacterium]|nr:MAG: sodium:proton antiporter [Gammaproteobacteria bacterium]